MNKLHRRLLPIGAAAAALTLAMTACNGAEDNGVETGPEDEAEDQQDVTIGLIPWEEAIALTYVWEQILERMDYNVTIENLDVAPTFQGVASGDLDLFLDTWLPDTHGEYMDEFGDDIEDLGVWYEDATLHLTVPEYVEEVDSIADLDDNADLFDSQIVGIESGSGLAQTTNNNVIPDYGLEDWDHDESSTAGMLTELETAIADEEPIVVTLWRPHIAYADYDLKDLEDPEGSLGEGETIHAIGRDGFGEDYPELTGYMEDFTIEPDELEALEEYVINEYEGDEGEGARIWLDENPQFVERALGEDGEELDFSEAL